jgi:hypothetical protein
MVQLISNYPSNLSFLLGISKILKISSLFFIIKTFGQIGLVTILTTWWPPGLICI